MNKFYIVENKDIKEISTVKDLEYMSKFLNTEVYKSVSEVQIPKGYKILDAKIVQMSDEEQYIEGILSLADYKVIKHNQIKQDFDDFESNGIKDGIMSETLGIKIQCAKSDIDKIQAIVSDYKTIGIPVPTFYKGIDEVKPGITYIDFENVYKELRNMYMSQWQRKQTRYEALKTATKDIEQI